MINPPFWKPCTLGLLALASMVQLAFAQTQNGDFVAGSGNISVNGNSLNVNAFTQRSVVDWNAFSVPQGNTANFNLPNPSSAILNRVTSQGIPSQINGAINSNGNVYLINPSGVFVGPSGTVNTNGFTASVFDVTNQQFMNGGPLNFNGSSNAQIFNQGTINTGAGGAHFFGNHIQNLGTITSQGGNVTMTQGGTVIQNDNTVYVQPDLATVRNGINEYSAYIGNTGAIRATGATIQGGEVYLGALSGTVSNSGSITANHYNPVSQGDFGGKVTVTGRNVVIADGSEIRASGANGGGTIQIGGGYQGQQAEVFNSQSTVVASQATLDASATTTGDAGQVIVWSDGNTDFQGTAVAKSNDGEAGFVEVSGKQRLEFAGQVDTGGGKLLLDPFDYTIDSVAAANIVAALLNNDVTVQTNVDAASFGSSGDDTQNGDITVNSAIVWDSAQTLTLLAEGDLFINADVLNTHIPNNSSSPAGDINLIAGWNPATPFSLDFRDEPLDTTTAFGLNNSLVQIGNGLQTSPISVGSRNGNARVFANDLIVNGGNLGGSAQLGFRVGVGGSSNILRRNIEVFARNDIQVLGGSAFAQIGDIGGQALGTTPLQTLSSAAGSQPIIDLNAGGNIILQGGTQTGAYAQVGIGGTQTNLNGTNLIVLNALGDLTINGGSGDGAYAQIGNGGLDSSTGTNTGIIIEQVQNLNLSRGIGEDAYAKIGLGGVGSTGNQGGNISLNVLGNLTLGNSAGTTNPADVQIGHGSFINSEGNRSGSITIDVAGETSLPSVVDSTMAAWLLGHATDSGSIPFGTRLELTTDTMDYSSGSNSTESLINTVFSDRLSQVLGTHQVSLVSRSDLAQEGNIDYASRSFLRLVSENDITILGTIFNRGEIATGDIELLAGYDGSTPLSSIVNNSSSYGLNDGSVQIGGAGQTTAAAVGTRRPRTRVRGHSLSIIGGSGDGAFAQLGLVEGDRGNNFEIFGAIDVIALDSLQIQGGSGDGAYAQIGHLGAELVDNSIADAEVASSITLNVGSMVSVNGGSGNSAYGQIGHGGDDREASLSGTINIFNVNDIELARGSGEFADARIGNGGSNFSGFASGGITLDASGNLDFRAPDVMTAARASIGHGHPNGTGNRSGQIQLNINGETSLLTDPDGFSVWDIGHRSQTANASGTFASNINWFTTSVDYDADSSAAETILREDFADRITNTLETSSVTLGVDNDIIVVADHLYDGTGRFSLLTESQIHVNANILNSYESGANGSSTLGSINLVAGWDGTPFSVSNFRAENVNTTTVFGNLGGDVTIGNTALTTGVAVGSQSGEINVFGRNLVLQAGSSADAFAQLGFKIDENSLQTQDVLSNIRVLATDSVSLQASAFENAYAQIGLLGLELSHTGNTSANASGVIQVDAANNLNLTAADADFAAAKIGHGGPDVAGNFSGSIRIETGGDLNFASPIRTTDEPMVHIGNGARNNSDGNRSGVVGLHIAGETSFLEETSLWDIGNLGSGEAADVNISGDFTLLTSAFDFDSSDAVDSMITENFAQKLGNVLNGRVSNGDSTIGGQVTIGVDSKLIVNSDVVSEGFGSIGLLSTGDIRVHSDIQSLSGRVALVAGWDNVSGVERTQFAPNFEADGTFLGTGFLNSGPSNINRYGNNDSSVFIDTNVLDAGPVAVGGGRDTGSGNNVRLGTQIFAHDLRLTGSTSVAGSSAQVGVRLADMNNDVGLSSDILIRTTGITDLVSNVGGSQIGHIGSDASSNSIIEGFVGSADINIASFEGVYLAAGTGTHSISQIGHGGINADGNFNGDILVQTSRQPGTAFDIRLIRGTGDQAAAKIGHGGAFGDGDLDGSIELRASGDLVFSADSTGVNSDLQIGHGSAFSSTGSRSGHMDIRIDGETSLVNSPIRWDIGHLSDTVTTLNGDPALSSANVTLVTGTLDYDPNSPSTDSQINQDFANKMVANLVGGHVTIGAVSELSVDSDLVYSSPFNLSLLAAGDLNINSNIQNDFTATESDQSQINLVGGWDGSVGVVGINTSNFAGPNPLTFSVNAFNTVDLMSDPRIRFGIDNGSIRIGRGTQSDSIAVGSRSGQTNAWASDVVLQSGSSSAASTQLGFQVDSVLESDPVSGGIRVRTYDSIRLLANEEDAFAQIGHVGGRFDGLTTQVDVGTANFSAPTIQLEAGGNIDILAAESYSQVGHGGPNTSGTIDGLININKVTDLNLVRGFNGEAYTRLGHGGLDTMGVLSGDLIVNATGNLELSGNGNAGLQIGHGSRFNSSGDRTGSIDIQVVGETSLVAPWDIGHLTDSGSISDANVTLSTGTLDYEAGTGASNTTLNDDFAQRFVDNLQGGHVTVISTDSDAMILEADMRYDSRFDLTLLSSTDIRLNADIQNRFFDDEILFADVNVIAGWNTGNQVGLAPLQNRIGNPDGTANNPNIGRPFDPSSLLTGPRRPSNFGLDNGSVLIQADPSRSLSIGSRSGRTNVLGFDVDLISTGEFAHIGFDGIASGSDEIAPGVITVRGSDQVNIVGGNSSNAFATIGHINTNTVDSMGTDSNGNMFDIYDIVVDAGELNLTGGDAASADATIGHLALGSDRNLRGDIRLFVFPEASGPNVFGTGNVNMTSSAAAQTRIGHGRNGSSGLRSGSMQINVQNEISLLSGDNWDIGHLGNGLNSDADIAIFTGSLDYDSTTLANDSTINQIFADKFVRNLAGGNVTLGADSILFVDGEFIYDQSQNLSLLSSDDIEINQNIQNNGAGDVSALAGWRPGQALNGFERQFRPESILDNSREFGDLNNQGLPRLGAFESRNKILIGSGQQTAGISFGSRNGASNAFAHQIELLASDVDDGYAQLGFRQAESNDPFSVLGEINSLTFGNIVARGGTGDSAFVQIGHGGGRFDNIGSDPAGTVDVMAPIRVYTIRGSIPESTSQLGLSFRGGSGGGAYAQIGHGGANSFGDHLGTIGLNFDSGEELSTQNLEFLSGTGQGSYSQFGHGGLNSVGNSDGSLSLRTVGSLTFVGGSGLADSYSQLGHGGLNAIGDRVGDFELLGAANIIFEAGDSRNAYSQFGHGGKLAAGNHSGSITALQTGDVDLIAGNARDAYAQLGHGGIEAPGDRFGDIIIRGGNVTLATAEDDLANPSADLSGTTVQLGHGGLGSDGNNSGDITLILFNGRSLDVQGQDLLDRYAIIGHGDELAPLLVNRIPPQDLGDAIPETDLGEISSGDIFVEVGDDAMLRNAVIGHWLDAEGIYESGSTALATGNGFFNGSNRDDLLNIDGMVQMRSAAVVPGSMTTDPNETGELRIYLPRRDSLQFADATSTFELNGVSFVEADLPPDEIFPNEEVFITDPFSGNPLLGDPLVSNGFYREELPAQTQSRSDIGNFGFYFRGIELRLAAASGGQEYGDDPFQFAGLSPNEWLFEFGNYGSGSPPELLEGDTLQTIGLRDRFVKVGDPAITGSYDDLVTSGEISTFTPAGTTYEIQVDPQFIDHIYRLEGVSNNPAIGTYSVSRAPLNIIVNDEINPTQFGQEFNFTSDEFTINSQTPLKNQETVDAIQLFIQEINRVLEEGEALEFTPDNYTIELDRSEIVSFSPTFAESNYIISMVTESGGNNIDLQIDPADIIIRPLAQTKQFGDSLIFDDVFNDATMPAFEVIGLAPSDEGSVIGLNLSLDSNVLDADADVGLYNILADPNPENLEIVDGFSLFNNENYNPDVLIESLLAVQGEGFSVTPAPLTIAPLEATKTFGEGFNFSSLAFDDKAAIIAGDLKNGNQIIDIGVFSAGTAENAPAGNYVISTDQTPIGANGFKESNYDITYQELEVFTVSPRELILTPLPQTKVYGSEDFDLSAFEADGLASFDIGEITEIGLTSDGIPRPSPVGKYDIFADINAIQTVGDIDLDNYDITVNNLPMGLMVIAAPLEITPIDQTKVYGDSFSFASMALDQIVEIEGLQNDDTITGIGVSSNQAVLPAANVGLYDIVTDENILGDIDLNNYEVVFNTGIFEVTPAPLTITTLAQSKIYGDSFNFNELTLTQAVEIDGLRNNDQIDSIGVMSPNGAVATADVDEYVIITDQNPIGQNFVAENYSIVYFNNDLTVLPAELTITALDQNKVFGTEFQFVGDEFSALGLRNNDQIDLVDLTSEATDVDAAPGTFPIVPSNPVGSNFSTGNYDIAFNNGEFLVTPLPGIDVIYDRFIRYQHLLETGKLLLESEESNSNEIRINGNRVSGVQDSSFLDDGETTDEDDAEGR